MVKRRRRTMASRRNAVTRAGSTNESLRNTAAMLPGNLFVREDDPRIHRSGVPFVFDTEAALAQFAAERILEQKFPLSRAMGPCGRKVDTRNLRGSRGRGLSGGCEQHLYLLWMKRTFERQGVALAVHRTDAPPQASSMLTNART
jgi:hypothetical protein